jgi:cyclic-di-GMP phosphodiesterase TipF (flagellum assembly factor)
VRRKIETDNGPRRGFGRIGVVALLGGVGVGALATAAPSLIAGAGLVETAAIALALGGIGIGGAATLWARRLRDNADKTSSDLDVLSRRLLRIEARLAEMDRSGNADLRGTVAEVTGEIALLSGLLRDLAATVAGHDREMGTLKARADDVTVETRAAPAPPVAPAAAPPALRINVAPEPAPMPVPAPQPQRVTASALVAPVAAQRGEAAPVADAAFEHDPLLFVRRDPPAETADDPRGRAILAALRGDRLEIHLQPIVSLPQRKTRCYEALARLRIEPDTLLVPAEFMPTIERAGLAPELDGKVVARAAAVARHLAARGSEAFVTCNLSPASLKTPGFMRALGRIVEAYPDVLGRLALEISQRCWRMLDVDTAGSLAGLRGKGLTFVLDRATDLRLDPLALADRGVQIVKLPADMLLRPQPVHGLDVEMADLTALLGRAGIRLVAERVEHEEDVPDLIELDIPLAQGFVFAAPRAVRADVIGGPPPPGRDRPAGPGAAAPETAAQPRPGAPPPARPELKAARPNQEARAAQAPRPAQPSPEPAAEQRLPFRSFLRRAV